MTTHVKKNIFFKDMMSSNSIFKTPHVSLDRRHLSANNNILETGIYIIIFEININIKRT